MPAIDIDKRRIFARAYATSGNATAAAKEAGVPTASAHSMGYKWLQSPQVMNMVRDEQNRHLRGLTGAALNVLARILLDETAPAQVQLSAAREVLDRAGFAKPRRQEVTTAVKPVEEMSRAELENFIAEDLGVSIPDVYCAISQPQLAPSARS